MSERASEMQSYYYQRSRAAFNLPSVTISLVIANVAVYVVTLVLGDQSILLLAQTGNQFFQGAYWQLFTSMFVHFSPLHLLFNMWGLFYFGRLNEANFTSRQYLAIYFVSGVLGNTASLALIPSDVPSGGASGAIFGLVGSYVAIERKANHLAMGVFFAVLIFIQSTGPGVNIFAHLFGLIGGLVLGLVYMRWGRPRESTR